MCSGVYVLFIVQSAFLRIRFRETEKNKNKYTNGTLQSSRTASKGVSMASNARQTISWNAAGMGSRAKKSFVMTP